MEELFLSVLKMSIVSSYVIIFVLIARLFLKKCPKIFSYALWAVVLFRLLCPISFESKLSFIPNRSVSKGSEILNNSLTNYDYNKTEIPLNNIVDKGDNLQESTITDEVDSSNTSISPINITSIASTLWAAAISIMITYCIYSITKLKKHLRYATLVVDNIYEDSNINTAFVMGVINPKIYIPTGLSDNEKQYIVAHERVHIKRCDYLIKLVAYAALTIHCFNPLVWVAFVFMSKDMEMSCDEAVVKEMGSNIKREYSKSLLSFATEKSVSVTPIAFGEGDVKSRIKNVLSYKKPSFWILVVSTIAVGIIGFGLMFNPVNNESIDEYLDINKILETIEASDEVILRRIGESGHIWPGATFTDNFISKIKDIKEHKVDSSYELSAEIVIYIYGNPDYTLSFYESEPKLMKVTYNGKYKYYTSSTDMYREVNSISLLMNYMVQDEIMVAVMDGKKTNKTSYEDRPMGVEYLQLSIGESKYFIYKDKSKYYVERPYVAIYEISQEVYENAIQFAQKPEDYSNVAIDDVYIENLVCKTIEENGGGYIKENILIVAPKIFEYYEDENKLKVFTTVFISNYSLKEKIVELESGGISTYAITYTKGESGAYELEELKPALDGGLLESSIRELCTMPVSNKEIKGLADKIIDYDYTELMDLEKVKLMMYLQEQNLKGVSLLERGYNEPDKVIPLTAE